MGYSQAYHLDCAQAVEQYNSDCCIPAEFGRVRSVAFIRKAYLQQILSDPTNATKWSDGIANGFVAIIPFASGSFDSGKPQKLKGYGRRLSTHGYRDMTLNFSIPFSPDNYAFFDSLDKFTDLVPSFRTSGLLHVLDQSADIITQEVIEDDLETPVGWNVECTIRSKKIPVSVDVANLLDIFSCTNYLLLETGEQFLTEEGDFINLE